MVMEPYPFEEKTEDEEYYETLAEDDLEGKVFVYENDGIPTPDFRKKKKGDFFRGHGRFLLITVLCAMVLVCAAGFCGYELGSRSAFGEGYENGYEEGNDLGYNDGFETGKDEGYQTGYDEGVEAAKNDAYYGIYGGENTEGAVAGSADTVYLTSSGSCYHREGCSYIAGKSGLTTMTESEAVSAGYSPCSRCN